ncbi:MAG: isocitrate lyase/phosphoenolpyruvate mutase family protein [Alphaproteobacteria bacterium]|nr:isocitrate lyase/phosphoenolpyruvate mutase family protein [Alphaproteobacteria bacterium]
MTSLKQRFARPGIVVAPGIYDGLSAMLVEQAGFEAAYLSGASIAYTRFGFPDIGLVSVSEVIDTLAAIRERMTIPVIVDIDTGFGNALNVQRSIRGFERAGASAVQLEDQVTPKRCGHLKDKALISKSEMVGKIKAALDARTGDMALICRTDAIAVEGFDAALERADAYAEAGADMLFVEAPPSTEHLAQVAKRYAGKVPVMANMVEGGKTPILSGEELDRLGYKLVIFPGGTVRALSFALQDYFQSLKSNGTTTPWRNRMLDFAGLNKLIDTDGFLARGKRYEG